MNRLDRLYALVEELRAAGSSGRSARRLADRFEVSVRTIERDVLALQEAGVPISAQLGRRGGYVLDRSMTLPPLNFTPAEAVALSVGLRRLGGYLHGGMTSWRQEKREIERVERMPLEELPKHAELVQILDVRERSEYDAGHIPGSAFTPWHDIDGLPDGLDPQRPVAVVCASGQRAATAASLVLRAGAREVIHVVEGGVPKWGRLGNPIEKS